MVVLVLGYALIENAYSLFNVSYTVTNLCTSPEYKESRILGTSLNNMIFI